MKSALVFLALCSMFTPALCVPAGLRAQDSKPSSDSVAKPGAAPRETKTAQQYSGMYTFLKDGEFLQLTIEDDGRVTGFISRFGEGENDKGAFLDQFFKNGKLDGNKLTFLTQVLHGVDFEFRGSVERGDGKDPSDEAYFVLKGSLTQNTTDTNKKSTSHTQDVLFKLFPRDAAPAAVGRN